MKKMLAVMLAATLIPLSGAVACQQAVEDRAREEVDKQVEKGKQRINEEVQKGQKRIEQEMTDARQQVEDGVRKAQKEAERRSGGGQ